MAEKKFYIYIEEIDGTYYNSKTSVMAENEEEALNKYIDYIKIKGCDDDGNIFDYEDKWRLYASENPNYVEDYFKWLKEQEEEEILWTRPIQL